MKVGDTVKFQFGNEKKKRDTAQKEGVIVKLFEKTVYIEADFPNHKAKLIRRKRHQVS